MNHTLDVLLAHRSYRAYTDEPVSEADLDVIIAAAHRAPTSINSQQISLVVVRDAARRAKIAEYTGGQPWIAQAPIYICVVIDFAKTDAALRHVGATQLVHESLEGFASAATDGGIVLATLMTAARSLGLGVVAIGGTRKSPQAMIDMLKLPPLTYPLVGCVIGHFAAEPAQKPRLPLATFRHDETYRGVPDGATIDTYGNELMDYWQQIGRADGQPWAENLAPFYSRVYYPDTKPVAAQQGLLVDK